MLGRIRSVFAGSWVARILAALLAVSFGAWGIQGALFGSGVGPQSVARVAGRDVGAGEFDRAYQGELREAADAMARQQGTPPDPSAIPAPMRHEIAQQALRQVVEQAVLVARAHAIGLRVPDAALRQAVFGIPAFKGADGSFDREKFDAVLRSNGLTEARLLALVSDDLASQGMATPLHAAVVVPAPMLDTLFAFGAEQRVMDVATVPFASVPAPAAPDEAMLRRFYANHLAQFREPEMRKIRTVVLSKETVGRDLTVSDADVRAAYEARRAQLVKPPRRSVEVVTLPDQARAAAIAASWRGGAAWPAVSAAAAKAGGVAIPLEASSKVEIPSATLADAVFAAQPSTVTGPVKIDQSWDVFEVTGVVPGSGDFASVKDGLREQIADGRAAGMVQDRVDRLQDAIAGGGLDKIPSDLGAAAAEGTLDAQGNTADGSPAPLPGSDAIRHAIVSRAFSEAKGAAPALQPAPDGGYYAVEVLDVTPARQRSFEAARGDVETAWRRDAVRHAAETRAAALYAAAQAAHALGPAAAGMGIGVTTTPPFRRSGAGPSVPQALVTVAFGLKPSKATMVETPDGFAVGVLTRVIHPPLGADDPGAARLRDELARSIADDVETEYLGSLMRATPPRINQQVVDRVVGQ